MSLESILDASSLICFVLSTVAQTGLPNHNPDSGGEDMKRGGGLSCCITVLYLLGPLLSIQPVDTRPTEAPFVSLLDLLIARDDIDTTLSLQSQQRIRRSVGSNHFHLTSRTGYKLAIAPDGTVNGTTSEQDPNSNYSLFRVSLEICSSEPTC